METIIASHRITYFDPRTGKEDFKAGEFVAAPSAFSACYMVRNVVPGRIIITARNVLTGEEVTHSAKWLRK